MNLHRSAILLLLSALYAHAATSFRYFYDDANELYRVLDSTGTLIEYTYDPSGNIVNVSRTTVPPNQLSILNVTPINTVGGSTITILGQNFSAIAAGDIVMIGGVAATVISATATQLVVKVPNTGSGGAVSVTVNGVTATWSNTISVLQPPLITSISPTSGKNSATVTLTVNGLNLFGATFVLQSIDPADTTPGAAITVNANNGTQATLTLVLGSTEGQFALVGTNSVGSGTITPASTFLIGPINNSANSYLSVLNTANTNPLLPVGQNTLASSVSVLNTTYNPITNPPFPAGSNSISSYASVLNTSFNPATNPPLPTGQNSATFYASVLNTTYNSITTPPFPPGSNSISSYTSVLNTSFNPATNPPLPTGQNSATFYASVLNTSDNLITNPPFPPGSNSISSYASVLNTSFNPSTDPPLPAGQNSVSYYISVCNTSSGCTATAPATVSVNASPGTLRPHPIAAPNPGPNGALPLLQPLDALTRVTAGQTIRLTARNVEPGSIVEFDVNRAAIATVREAPYETLFTVPDGPGELDFQLVVRSPDNTEGLSATTRIAVEPDTGADISGSIRQGDLELSLAAGGLKSDFFRLAQPVTARPSLERLIPAHSGYVTAINEPNPGAIFGDDPMGAHIVSDYAIRFSGEVRADTAGSYRFWLAARSGAAVWIDGKLLEDSGLVTGNPVETSFTVELQSGWHGLEVVYYLAVGPASLRLEWQQPSATRREVIGPEYLRTPLDGMTTVSSSDGAFLFPKTPKIFDSVWIRLKRDTGLIEFPAVKPGDAAVSIAVPK